MAEFISGIHYYVEDTRVVFTEQWLVRKEECCGNKCRHCPFSPRHQKGSVEVAKEFIKFRDQMKENG